jgi:hypothetical protein
VPVGGLVEVVAKRGVDRPDLAGTGSGTVSDSALLTLRDQILPSTLGAVP